MYLVEKISILLFLFLAGESCDHRDVSSYDQPLPERISYNFHIRPILTDRCFSCHGPDEEARKGDLRLDLGGVLDLQSSVGDGKILVAGKPAKSVLWQRIQSDDPEYIMPPLESNLSLSEYEKLLIKKWIDQGAVFEPHWAFQPISKPVIPETGKSNLDNIDAFIYEKLSAAGLEFAGQADPAILLRRLFFDLTGLGPLPQQVDAFLRDRDPRAYESIVDSLLNTTAYAERMTTDWLDLARYADSQGMHSDGWRSMYPWRDWVIRAFKDNMPYDQFVLEQLAGDLLEHPDTDQLVATGFNRNHQTTAEGGVVDEEFKMEYVHDRVSTTATTFLGLTMECARCHDHKYDPISQEEYYQFFGFFDQVEEVGMTGDDGNSGPNLLLPDKLTRAKIDSLQKMIDLYNDDIQLDLDRVVNQAEFIRNLPEISFSEGRQVYLPFQKIQERIVDANSKATASPGVEIVDTERGKVIYFNDEYEYVTIQQVGLFDQNQPFSVSLWINPADQRASQTLVGNSGQKGVFWRGWDFILDSLNRPTLRLIHALPHDMLVVQADEKMILNQWSHLAFSYDGSGEASGVRIYKNGFELETDILSDQLQRSIYPMAFNKESTDTPLRVGKSYRAFTGEYGIYEGMMDDLMVFNRELSAIEVGELAGKNTLRKVKQDYLEQRSDTLGNKLKEYDQLRSMIPQQIEVQRLRQEVIELWSRVPEVMVMKDRVIPKPTRILNRGNYDQPGDQVFPGTPKSILFFSDSLPKNRLGLAGWIINNNNPLTSRVVVNRLWQQFFGRGIVQTAHDFGMQGDLPSHPELLDYLAARLMEGGWDLQKIIRDIVLSKTYRQSSKIDVVKRALDPENRLLSRGPSSRLTAEMLRDQALLSAFLLDSSVGGPSVKPWQPEGLWEEKTSSTHLLASYKPDLGVSRYRRSLYTFVRRTSMHPMMEVFDAPTRSVCVVKRQSTDTPVQALVLLNDPQFIEAARHLAEAMLRDFDRPEDWISEGYQRLCCQEISSETKRLLLDFYQKEKERFTLNAEHALAYVSIGQYGPKLADQAADLAATTLVFNTIMNIDDFYIKR